MNPGYLAILANAGGEDQLLLAFTSIQLKMFINFLNGQFLEDARLHDVCMDKK